MWGRIWVNFDGFSAGSGRWVRVYYVVVLVDAFWASEQASADKDIEETFALFPWLLPRAFAKFCSPYNEVNLLAPSWLQL